MIILTIRTDKPEAEIGLYDDQRQLAYEAWQAHRALGMTIHLKIEELLQHSGKNLHDIQGIICYEGPGSFTGLRIGLTVANALAYALHIPVLARRDQRWLEVGVLDILAGKDDRIALPEYGSEAHTTLSRK
jgi:tRNA threonylcarbamoyladenosine biosynthesis protein TsaB